MRRRRGTGSGGARSPATRSARTAGRTATPTATGRSWDRWVRDTGTGGERSPQPSPPPAVSRGADYRAVLAAGWEPAAVGVREEAAEEHLRERQVLRCFEAARGRCGSRPCGRPLGAAARAERLRVPDAGMGGAARPALRTGLGGPGVCRAPGRDVDLRNGDGEALCFALVC